MNNLRSALFLALSLPSISFATQAQDFCSALNNTHWVGGGEANGAMKCQYRGEGNVVKNANFYRLTFRASKTSGGSLCPQQIINYVFNFTCTNNQLSASEEGMTMTGTIINPQRVSMHGKISIFDMVENIEITALIG